MDTVSNCWWYADTHLLLCHLLKERKSCNSTTTDPASHLTYTTGAIASLRQSRAVDAGGPPTGFFYFQSAVREASGGQHLWLGLEGTAEPLQQLRMVQQDAAVLLHLAPLHENANHISVQVLASTPLLYVTVPKEQPAVELSQTVDDSGCQMWNATQAKAVDGAVGWKLSVSDGHKDGQGQQSLSCGLVAIEEQVDLSQDHCWFIEKVSTKGSQECVVQ